MSTWQEPAWSRCARPCHTGFSSAVEVPAGEHVSAIGFPPVTPEAAGSTLVDPASSADRSRSADFSWIHNGSGLRVAPAAGSRPCALQPANACVRRASADLASSNPRACCRESALFGFVLDSVAGCTVAAENERHLQHRCLTCRVISRLEGGFSPRPSECSISWMTAARTSSGARSAARMKSRPQR